jgi:hypothetical protein
MSEDGSLDCLRDYRFEGMVHWYFVAVAGFGVGLVELASSMGSGGVAGSSVAATSLIVVVSPVA